VFPNSTCQYLHNRDSDNDFVSNVVNIRTEHKQKERSKFNDATDQSLQQGVLNFMPSKRRCLFFKLQIFATKAFKPEGDQARQLESSTGLSR